MGNLQTDKASAVLRSKARLEVEAGLFVDWQRGRIGPRGAPWRAFRALAFVIADRGSGPDSAGKATLPRKRPDARIAVARCAFTGAGRKDLPPHKVGARTATRLTERSRFHLERAPAP